MKQLSRFDGKTGRGGRRKGCAAYRLMAAPPVKRNRRLKAAKMIADNVFTIKGGCGGK